MGERAPFTRPPPPITFSDSSLHPRPPWPAGDFVQNDGVFLEGGQRLGKRWLNAGRPFDVRRCAPRGTVPRRGVTLNVEL